MLPLMSSIIRGLFGRFIGRGGSVRLATANIWCAAAVSLLAAWRLVQSQEIVHYNFDNWLFFMTIESPTFEYSRWEPWSWFLVDWTFAVDSLTAAMLVVVTTIAALVHTFSAFYMGEDPYVSRFFAYLSLFAFFMLVLVSAENFLILFVGWEGVGIMSFLLINFWYTRALANKAAIKAVVVNRVGDVFLLTGLALIFSMARSLDFGVVFPLVDAIVDDGLTSDLEWVGLFLLLAAVGTSAQLGLHTWLPDAM